MSPARRLTRPSDAPPVDPSAALAASAALRRSAVALGHAREARAADADGTDHWASDDPLSGAMEARERLARTGERQIWAAQDSAETTFAREVGTYTRLLRDGGVPARQTLVAVAAVVREAAAPSLDGDALDVAIHDAGRQCVEAYFARPAAP